MGKCSGLKSIFAQMTLSLIIIWRGDIEGGAKGQVPLWSQWHGWLSLGLLENPKLLFKPCLKVKHYIWGFKQLDEEYIVVWLLLLLVVVLYFPHLWGSFHLFYFSSEEVELAWMVLQPPPFPIYFLFIQHGWPWTSLSLSQSNSPHLTGLLLWRK